MMPHALWVKLIWYPLAAGFLIGILFTVGAAWLYLCWAARASR